MAFIGATLAANVTGAAGAESAARAGVAEARSKIPRATYSRPKDGNVFIFIGSRGARGLTSNRQAVHAKTLAYLWERLYAATTGIAMSFVAA
jgi:hypothetical protein